MQQGLVSRKLRGFTRLGSALPLPGFLSSKATSLHTWGGAWVVQIRPASKAHCILACGADVDSVHCTIVLHTLSFRIQAFRIEEISEPCRLLGAVQDKEGSRGLAWSFLGIPRAVCRSGDSRSLFVLIW